MFDPGYRSRATEAEDEVTFPVPDLDAARDGVRPLVEAESSVMRTSSVMRVFPRLARARGIRRRTATHARRLHLQGPQCRRTLLRPGQVVAGLGHPLRQARHHLPRRRRPLRMHHLDTHIRRHALEAGAKELLRDNQVSRFGPSLDEAKLGVLSIGANRDAAEASRTAGHRS